MRILITGYAGYIGSKLMQVLGKLDILDYFVPFTSEHVDLVVGIDSFIYNNFYFQNSDNMFTKYIFYNLCTVKQIEDIINIAKLHNIDTIIPLAALVGASICDKYPELAKATNTDSIIKLARAFPEARFIYTNTNSGYGKTEEGELCDESTPMNPISLYGETKVKTEQYLLNNNNATSLRLGTVFGHSPRMRLDLLVNDWTLKVTRDDSIVIFDPSFRRNYINVKDVANAIVHCLHKPEDTQGQIFNLGNDNANCNKLELINKIVNILGKKETFNISIGNGYDPDQRDYIVTSQKLYNTGFEPKISLESGIRELAAYYSIFPKNNQKFAEICKGKYNVLDANHKGPI